MSTEDTTKLIEASRHIASELRFGPVVTRTQITALADALESLVAENEKLRAESKEAHTLAKDWYEESERGFDKIVAVREWFTENQEHEVYEATEDQPAECTDECSACALLEILNSHTAVDGPLHALLTERHVLQAQLDRLITKWGVNVTWGSLYRVFEMPDRDSCDRFIRHQPLWYDHRDGEQFSVVNRLVGPWMVVSE